MLLVTVNKPKQILLFSFIGHIKAGELARGYKDMTTCLSELSPGFTLVTDLTSLEVIEKDSIQQITRAMEECDATGVGLVVRVIPDPRKDIGFNILSAFHYSHHPRTVICNSMVEAAKALSL